MNCRGKVPTFGVAVTCAMIFAGSCTSAGTGRRTTVAEPTRAPTAVAGVADPRALCTFLASVNIAADKAKSTKEGLTVLKSFEPAFDDQLASAPPALATDLNTVLEAARTALRKRDLAGLTTDRVAQAGSRLSAECHQGAPSPLPSSK
jgi:hypothetical protein